MMGRNLRSTIHGKEKEYEEFSETEGKKKCLVTIKREENENSKRIVTQGRPHYCIHIYTDTSVRVDSQRTH